MKPPALAQALLLAVAGESEAECIAGDLAEEFALVCEASGGAGARWYWSQVVRSLAPLVRIRMKSAEWYRAVSGAFLGVAIPLLVLDRLWSFVYSQIPLKDGIGRSPALLAVNVFCVCLSAALAASRVRSKGRAAASAFSMGAAAGLALWLSTGAAPAAYVFLALSAAPAGSLIAHKWRRSA